MSTQMTRFVVQALVALGAALIATAPAHATRWVGKWDPLYGAPFVTGGGIINYNLGWAGEVEVDAPCAAPPGGGDVTNAGACDGGAEVLTLEISLYDNADPLTILATLTSFDPSSLIIDTLRYSDSGKLLGISTTLSNFVQDTSAGPPPLGAGTGAFFAVQFVLDGELCLFCGDGEFFAGDPLPEDYRGPVLFASSDSDCAVAIDEFCTELRRNSTDPLDRPKINFTPEPSSLALLALGLLAAGAASRRRGARV